MNEFKIQRSYCSDDISNELTAGLQVEGTCDSSFKETNHVGGELIRVVQKDIVAAVMELEDLRVTELKVAIVLDDSVRTLSGTKEISRAVDKGNRELKVLQHLFFCEECVFQETEEAKISLANYVLIAPSSGHESVVFGTSVHKSIREKFFFQHFAEV